MSLFVFSDLNFNSRVPPSIEPKIPESSPSTYDARRIGEALLPLVALVPSVSMALQFVGGVYSSYQSLLDLKDNPDKSIRNIFKMSYHISSVAILYVAPSAVLLAQSTSEACKGIKRIVIGETEFHSLEAFKTAEKCVFVASIIIGGAELVLVAMVARTALESYRLSQYSEKKMTLETAVHAVLVGSRCYGIYNHINAHRNVFVYRFNQIKRSLRTINLLYSQTSSSVSAYLANLRESYDASIETKSALFQVVIGNEAADLDSISAAIVRAKHLSLEAMKVDEIFYPVVNIPRKDLALRRDAEYLFSLLNVDADSLLFVDEIPLDLLAMEGRLKLHLVDHNVLAIHQAHLRDQVVSIVDHHADEHVDYPECPKENKIVMTVGSATSLIAREILRDWGFKLDSSWRTLMLAPILLDTANLQSSSRTTQLDIDAVQKLEDLVEDCSLSDFFERLREARSDTEGFTTDMLLRKDLKRYQDGRLIYTISSLPYGTEYHWDQDSNLLDTLQDFRKKQAVPIAMVNEKSLLDQRRRLHVNCESSELLEQLIQHFSTNEALSEIARLERSDPDLATATWILPTSVTRKVLQPKLGLGSENSIPHF